VTRLAAVGAWPVRWVQSGRRGGLAGPLGSIWTPWGPGWSREFGLATVGAWLVPLVQSGRRGIVADPPGFGLRGGAWLVPWIWS